MTRSALTLSLALVASGATGQEASLNVEGRNGTAIIPDEASRRGAYDGRYHFAPAYRAGDYVFVSGVVAGAWEGEPLTRDGFAASVRRAFERLDLTLEAAGGDVEDVVRIRTFHVFDTPFLSIEKQDQVLVVAEVKADFIPEPHPAWTAVGTTALLPDRGIVEIEVVAYSPED